MKRALRWTLRFCLLVAVVFLAVSGLGYYRILQAAPNYESLDLFTRVLQFVQQSYVEEPDSKKLMEGAIKGMLATLDPHTIYLPPDQFKEMKVDTSGKFGGLGIEIAIRDGYLTVLTPIDDTPAFYAGIEPGDRIVVIEDKAKKLKKETKGMNLQEAVSLMRGEKGTKVTITVYRKGTEKLLPFEIKRDIIKVRSIKAGLFEEDYGWIRIANFQENTTRDLRRELDGIIKKNKRPLQGVVIDLRSNPGGLLEEAVGVSGTFLDKVPVVSTMGRNKAKKEVEYSRGDHPYKDFKIIVLVNEASASASEIVAGALQDHKRGLVAGKQTFGKGSVQTVLDLDGKAGLKLTVARYYTPSGRSIQGTGIKPDIEIDPLDVSLMEKARKGRYLREADLENHIVGENETKNKDEEEDLTKVTKGTDDKKEGKEEADRRPIREKDGKKIRIDDPKELVKTDFQLLQSLNYLKAWNVFHAAEKGEKKVTSSN